MPILSSFPMDDSAALALKQDKITGSSGQIVGFDSSGNPTAQTHFGTDTPKAAGTASVGSAATAARSDHVHPAQTTITGNAATASKLASSNTIDGVSFDGSAAITHYGTCSTAAATAAKTISLTNFSLVTGAVVHVKFTYANSAATPTLNVNSTGAKTIKTFGDTAANPVWAAGQTVTFVYDGTNWLCTPTGFLPEIEVTATSGTTTVTVTNGTISFSRSVSASTPGIFPLPSYGTWKVSGTYSSSATNTVTVEVDACKRYKVELTTAPYAKIYGASWDGTSTTKWTRTDDAAGFTDPVPYVSGASSYSSPFDDIAPWSGMVKSDRTAGTMVAIPKFYYRLSQNGLGLKVQITTKPMDGFVCSPAHMDRGDGKGERDTVYIGRYHCCASDYKSTTGVLPKASITRSAARTAIHNLGDTIWQADFAMRFTIWLLYIVEFADWNSQNVIGYGCGDNSAKGNMGYTDDMPYPTGTTATSRTTYGLGTQYRYIEGLWDNAYDWCDGCYNSSAGLNIILNPANFSDNSGGISAGIPSNGYPSAFKVSNNGGFPMFFPTKASGGSGTYSCDSWNFYASYPCVFVGGVYVQYASYGLFCLYYAGTSSTSGSIGSRLQELP